MFFQHYHLFRNIFIKKSESDDTVKNSQIIPFIQAILGNPCIMMRIKFIKPYMPYEAFNAPIIHF